MSSFHPSSITELADLVRTSERLPVPLLNAGEGLSFERLVGEIRHDVADGVVTCAAGTTLRELNERLGQDDRCLPHAAVWPAGADELPLAVLLLLGLPHAAEAARGTWRDWILGATMVTADGTVVKSGSRVVKSVAGYDAHKLLIGSRGTLVLPAEFHFRTAHVSMAPALPEPLHADVRSILRVQLTDQAAALAELKGEVVAHDPDTGTFWCACPVDELPSFPHAWTIDPFLPEIPAATLALHRHAKSTLDPTGKLAPNAFSNLI